MRELSLFTGAGGGILGTHLLGWTPIGYVEWDDYCQRVLAQRIADGIIARAPIFGDVRKFVESGAAREYRGFADVVTAGFPCQPFSYAGKQGGSDDERNMWPATAEVIRAVQPRSVFLENTPGLVSSGYLETVVKDLAEMGFVGRWGIVGALASGFPHARKRAWIVAHSKRCERRQEPHDGQDRRMGRQQQPFAWDRNWLDVFTGVRGNGDGVADRVGRTDAIRNGQVPRVVAAAWQLLSYGEGEVMSSGTMCLNCRLYISTDPVWQCTCANPVPSDDGVNPNPPAPDRLAQTVTPHSIVEIVSDAMEEGVNDCVTVREALESLKDDDFAFDIVRAVVEAAIRARESAPAQVCPICGGGTVGQPLCLCPKAAAPRAGG